MSATRAPVAPWRHVVARNVRVARRIWPAIVSGAMEPAFYLYAVGVGIGAFVGDLTAPDGSMVSYATFVAPALLAASAMNGAVTEATYNVHAKIAYDRTYVAMLATPLRPIDLAIGEIAYSQVRGAMYGLGFLVIAAVGGLVPSLVGGLLALPMATLVGLAFGAVAMVGTTWMRSWQDYDFIQLVTLPMFLFSATFYPLDVYPVWLQRVALASPLYHAVEAVRACWFLTFDASLVAHVLVLVAMAVVGLLVVRRRLTVLLTT